MIILLKPGDLNFTFLHDKSACRQGLHLSRLLLSKLSGTWHKILGGRLLLINFLITELAKGGIINSINFKYKVNINLPIDFHWE